MNSIFSNGLERENKELKCPNCKMKTKHQPSGFEGHNRRWTCLKCKEINSYYSEYD